MASASPSSSASSTESTSSGDASAAGGWRTTLTRIKQNLMKTEQTEFHQEFVQNLADSRSLGLKTKTLIKAVKQAAQPNPSYQV